MRSIQGELDDVINHEFHKTALANGMLEGVAAIGLFMRDFTPGNGSGQYPEELDGISQSAKS